MTIYKSDDFGNAIIARARKSKRDRGLAESGGGSSMSKSGKDAALGSESDLAGPLGGATVPHLARENDAYGSDSASRASRAASNVGAIDEVDKRDMLFSGKRERRFLFKLDLYLISWAFCAYLIKQIDSGNYRTAYASGMKEDMGMYGNELNYMDTTFRVGYAVFLIPSQLILTRIRPKYWLPPLELAWGVMTGLMAASSTVQGMYACRFFIGVFEASSYPGIVSVLCSWYTPSELATRVAIFSASYPVASMFVSTMQVAIQSTLHGARGIPGWKWLFILNAIMTVVVALMGFFMLPDRPGDAKVTWMTEEDEAIAQWRVQRVNKLPPTKLSWKIVRETFSGWLIYVFTISYAFWGWCTNSNLWIILFLKAEKNADGTPRFTVQEINAIPIGGYALMLVCMLLFAWASSRTGWRAFWIVAQMVPHLIGLVILSVWPLSFSAKMVGFFSCWTSMGVGPILVAWMADWCPSPEKRNIIVGVCVTVVYAVDSFANIFIYPAVEAPNYRIGYKAALAFGIACLLGVGVFRWQDYRLRGRTYFSAKAAATATSTGRSETESEIEDEGASTTGAVSDLRGSAEAERGVEQGDDASRGKGC